MQLMEIEKLPTPQPVLRSLGFYSFFDIVVYAPLALTPGKFNTAPGKAHTAPGKCHATPNVGHILVTININVNMAGHR